jgi:hypothetical protein
MTLYRKNIDPVRTSINFSQLQSFLFEIEGDQNLIGIFVLDKNNKPLWSARAAERERQKAERAARTASRAAKKASKGKGKAARAAHASVGLKPLSSILVPLFYHARTFFKNC